MRRGELFARYGGFWPIAGAEGDDDPPKDPPKDPPPNPNPPPADGERKFTQADLDRQIEARLAEEKRRQEARDKKAADEAEAKRLTEQQEFQKLAEKEKARADTLEQAQAQEQQRRRALALDYEGQLVGSKLGLANPKVALRLLDLDQVEYGEDDKPTNLEALLDKLAETEPYLKAEGDGKGGGVPPTPRGNRETASKADQVAQAKKELQASGGWSI